MSKKKAICFYAMTAILFALIFIVAVFLRVKTFEYIILLILIAGLIYLKQSQRIVRLWQISLISIGLFFIACLTTALTRPNLKVSLSGNLINNAFQMINRHYESQHGESFIIKKWRHHLITTSRIGNHLRPIEIKKFISSMHVLTYFQKSSPMHQKKSFIKFTVVVI